jgi:hypothetical protein
MVKGKVLLALTLGLGACTTFAQSNRDDSVGRPEQKLEVEISSNKSAYRAGEPIIITIILRNKTKNVVWVSKPIGVGRDPGQFYVDAVGPDGVLLRNESPVTAGSAPSKRSKDSLLQDFLCYHVPFFPGEFWGLSRSLEDAFISPKSPGKYKITAKYLAEPLRDLSKNQTDTLQRELKFPIQMEPVISEPLIIEIH